MTAPTETPTLYTEFYALGMPDNIAFLEHLCDVPGPKVIIPVDSVAEAVDEADGRTAYLFSSPIVEGLLYLVLPAEIETVSIIHHGDVIRVREVTR
jgi:hypothetical protein